MDDDCDGLARIRRDYVTGFEPMATSDWSVTAGSSFTGGQVLLHPAPALARLTFTRTLDFASGELTVTIDMDALTTGGCALRVGLQGQASVAPLPLGLGVNHYTRAASPGAVINSMTVECLGSGEARVDWLTVQNGGYDFAPLQDLDLVSETMSLPGSEYSTLLRTSEDGDTLFAGNNGSGLAISDRATGIFGFTWRYANGDSTTTPGTSLNASVWDVWGAGGNEIYALTGIRVNTTTTDEVDGLWYTSDRGGSWMNLNPDLRAERAQDDCEGSTYQAPSGNGTTPVAYYDQPTSGGTLILSPRGTDSLLLLLAQEEAETESAPTSTRGVWAMTRSLGARTFCQPYVGLPVEVSVAGESTPYTFLPGAMAIYEDPTTMSERLLVGYRVPARTLADADYRTLYTCPLPDASWSCGDATFTCEAVDDGDELPEEGMDVRDLATDPAVPSRVWIADGGRQPPDGTGGEHACTHRESSVYVVDFSGTTPEVWDSDGASAEPGWWTSTTLPSYYQTTAGGGCYYKPETAELPQTGNLQSPNGSALSVGGEIGAITVDPYGDYVFAFYDAVSNNRDYGCVRNFRGDIPASLATDDTLEWMPLQGVADTAAGEEDDGAERATTIEFGGSWVGQQRPLQTWAPGFSVTDATFVMDMIDGQPALGVTSFHPWWIPAATLGNAGWDGDTSLDDYDILKWWLGWDGEDPAYQQNGGPGIAVCHNCDDDDADRVFRGLTDLGGATLHGDLGGGRAPAEKDCHFEALGLGGWGVSVWHPESIQQVWMALRAQGNDEIDPNQQRTLLYSEDGGETWMWDTWRASSRSFIRTSPWRVLCRDEDEGNLWYPMDAAGPTHMETDQVGQPTEILAFADRRALLLSSPAVGGSGYDASLGGLWVVEYTGSAVSYTRVEGFGPLTADCTEEQFFDFNQSLDIQLAPDSDPDGTGYMHVYLSQAGNAPYDPDSSDGIVPIAGTECGIREVAWTLGAESGATWYRLDYEAGAPCDLAQADIGGIALSPEGDRLYLFGGDEFDIEHRPGGLCEVELPGPPGTIGDVTQVIPSGSPPPIPGGGSGNPNAILGKMWDLFPHPHITGLYFGIVEADLSCARCGPPGVYAIQERWSPSTNTWKWLARRISQPDLAVRGGNALDWGSDPDGHLSDLYLSTLGGGTWDAWLDW